jgi:hypothetical protein
VEAAGLVGLTASEAAVPNPPPSAARPAGWPSAGRSPAFGGLFTFRDKSLRFPAIYPRCVDA